MDVYWAVKNYLSKMVTMAGNGMKVLLLDDDTLKTVSLVSSMSEIMKQEVYLIERIKLPREPLEHLRCICFLRPSKENINMLSQELRKPNYASYYIFFSHTLTKQSLKQLAEADENELVVEVQEYYADFMPLSPFLFELDLPFGLEGSGSVTSGAIDRCTDGITAVLLSLKICPIIRYQNVSESARRLAESIRSMISRETVLFDFRQPPEQSAVLLILDRRQDPVTPLLMQWTYEAMVHELLGIKQNRVNLSRVPNVRPELREITLSREFDEFFRANQFANYGEIGQSIKKLVEDFQSASRSVDTKNVESIADLKKFLENYPSFRKASGTVETHVTIVSELSRLVRERALLEVSEAEQELVCHDNHSANLSRVRGLLNDPRVILSDALRLVLLYALRYNNGQRKELAGLVKSLVTRGASDDDVQMIQQLLSFAGPRTRADGVDLFTAVKSVTAGGTHSLNGQSATSAMAAFTKRLVKGLKGVDNVYTQHEPSIVEILNDLLKGKLREAAFPCLSTGSCWKAIPTGQRPKKVIVFVLGGATYTEARVIHMLNASTPDTDIVLGGTCIHNSRSFLEEVNMATRPALVKSSSESPSSPAIAKPPESSLRSFGKVRSNIKYGLIKES
ncbi:unnamed protein product [Calicophoron daubneyi]|uniref:Vacuolar protein sorting-associated protein 45 n=1 Tax=Calicophoron daubneyi TaxID=300641 RepID=A0AAV2T0G4_CALDB